LLRFQTTLAREPSEGLAPMMVSEVYGILSELKRAGRAILLVEQNVPAPSERRINKLSTVNQLSPSGPPPKADIKRDVWMSA
jgi:branched-chain amino acid transport system ATP-binding protein